MEQSKIIGKSLKFQKALEKAKQVAASSANIFITGESGTGKEIFAKYIHTQSKNKNGPFVAINCSAIPESLLESELFGHSKGSFTGAQERRVGLFEEAQDGTLFLDEIGDLSLSLQAKLLRVLQEKQIRRVGENQTRAINCRIISATHKSIEKEIERHRFREDLFFRLDVIPIDIPPLRERLEDIIPLSEYFLEKYTKENNLSPKAISAEAKDYLIKNPWKGNVRELENFIERGVILCNSEEISLENFLPTTKTWHDNFIDSGIPADENTFSLSFTEKLPPLDEVINRYLEFAVAKNGGAKDKTAKEIGIDRKTLYKRIKLDNSISQVQNFRAKFPI